ncbi:MAG: metalloregulator ArsR/SmtB family transcription factor [Candidatus Cloacimonetes bacterium]|nr:metalloregulator ArsR/SmtB family transcription factor [Candidatus Cloacimonadota bacterium]
MAEHKCGCSSGGGCQCDSYEQEAGIFKAMGHPSRLQMIMALAEGRRCVCELQELVGSDISTVSRHLNVLKDHGIVSFQKEGNYYYYRLLMPCVLDFVNCISKERGCQCSPG